MAKKQRFCMVMAVLSALVAATTPSLADEPYIGEVRTVAFNFCPTG